MNYLHLSFNTSPEIMIACLLPFTVLLSFIGNKGLFDIELQMYGVKSTIISSWFKNTFNRKDQWFLMLFLYSFQPPHHKF